MHTAILQLETAGLLTRKAKNQRVVLVNLTHAGRKTLGVDTIALQGRARKTLYARR